MAFILYFGLLSAGSVLLVINLFFGNVFIKNSKDEKNQRGINTICLWKL